MTVIVNPFVAITAGGGGTSLPVSPLVWYKPDTGLFTDAGSTPVTSDGDLVYQWNDQSGNGYHAVQTSSGARPIYRPGTTDDRGKKALGFESNARWFALPDALATALNAAKQAEIFLKFINRQDNTHSSGHLHLGSVSQHAFLPWGGDGLIYEMALKNTRVDGVNPGKTLSASWTTYDVACHDSSLGTGTYDIWVDGVNQRAISGSVTFSVASSGLMLGQEAFGTIMDAYVTEVVVCASKLSSGDRTAMNTYFGL